MNQSYYLKTLGYPGLRGPDGNPIKFKVRKHLALLVFLAVEDRDSHRRETLVDLLWSGVPLSNGRHSLSMALTVLRAVLGRDSIRNTGSQLRFSPENLALDLDELAQGTALDDVASRQDIDAFLLDFEIADSPSFHHWRDRQQAQLLPALQAGLLSAINHARRSGDTAKVLQLAERLLDIDSFAEEGIRAKMEALALQGGRVSALRCFEAWSSTLRLELGASPSDLTQAIASRLRGRPPNGPPRVVETTVPIEHWAERTFVGRQAEHRTLFEAWESSTQLNSRHVLISGETGVGKSTLAMRFATSAALEGAAVARVQCFELEQRIAFGTIGALLGALLDRPGAIATSPASLAEIARVVPKVRERFSQLPPPRRTEGESARLHFAEGTFALLDAIMDEQPLILVVDDYPRSDEASLSVLHMLLRRTSNERLMVVLTGRPPEPGEPSQSARIRKGISYLPMRHLQLLPLKDNESEELLDSMFAGASRRPRLPERRLILRSSGGNPMAIELLAKDWAAHGDAAMALSIPSMRAEVPPTALQAVAFDRVLERLLPALSTRARLATYLAAILGPRLNDLDCFRIVGLSDARAVAALSELIDRRILRDVGGSLEFTNELIRARLYLKIPPALRLKLHKSVANRLLASDRYNEGVPGLEIAWHCIRSRRRDEATPFLMKGARDAILHGAPDEAARALSSALGHLRGRAKTDAALLLAETYHEMGQWQEALLYLRNTDGEDGEDSQVRELAEILEIEGKRHLGHYAISELSEMATLLMARTQHGASPSIRARAAVILAGVVADLKDPAASEAARRAVHNIQLDRFETWDRGRVLLAQAHTAYQTRHQDAGLKTALAAAGLLENAGATDTTYVRIQTGFGVIASAQGRYAEGIGPLERAYLAASRLDNLLLMCQAAYNLAICHSRTGTPEEHRHWAVLARNASKGLMPGGYERVISAVQYAAAHLSIGAREETEQGLEWIEQECRDTQYSWVLQCAELYRADINWLLGRKRIALAAARRARQIASKPLAIGFVGAFVRWNTILLLREGSALQAWEELREAYGDLSRLDAKDRADVLCSARLVSEATSVPVGDVDLAARTAVASLPTQYSRELERLGLLAN